MADVLVTVARFAAPHEAHLARGMLETHGIFVALLDEHVARTTGSGGGYVGGIRLQVTDQDATLAVDLLDLSGTRTEIERPSEEESFEGGIVGTGVGPAVGDNRCPLCGAPPRGLLARFTGGLVSMLGGSAGGQDLACSLCGSPREI